MKIAKTDNIRSPTAHGVSVVSNTPIKIDYTRIPSADLKNLCRTLTAAVKRFYDDPKNRDGFEKWQQKRKEEAKNATEKNNDSTVVCTFGGGNSYTDDRLQQRKSETA